MPTPQLLLQDVILSWQLPPLPRREAPRCLSGGSERSLTEEPETQHTRCSVNSPGQVPVLILFPGRGPEPEIVQQGPCKHPLEVQPIGSDGTPPLALIELRQLSVPQAPDDSAQAYRPRSQQDQSPRGPFRLRWALLSAASPTPGRAICGVLPTLFSLG